MQDGLANEVTDMTGILPGVYPAIHLYTHQGVNLESSPDMAISFETTRDGNERNAQIFLFGLCDPAHGETYTNQLELHLTLSDGSTTTVLFDLTAVLSNSIAQNGGVLPFEVPIHIQLTKTAVGVSASVEGWIEGGVTKSTIE